MSDSNTTPETISTSYDELWDPGQIPSDLVYSRIQTAFNFLGLDKMWWDARIVRSEDLPEGVHEPWMAVNGSDGNDGRILIFPCLVNMQARQKGLFVVATILHEVLELYLWWQEHAHKMALTEDYHDGLHTLRHNMLDRLAWTLVPHAYPDIDPEEDIFHEAVSCNSRTVTVDDFQPWKPLPGGASR